MEVNFDRKSEIESCTTEQTVVSEDNPKEFTSPPSSEGSESDEIDIQSDTNSDIIRLVTSTRNLLRASVESGSGEKSPELDLDELRQELAIPTSVELDEETALAMASLLSEECDPTKCLSTVTKEPNVEDMSVLCQKITSDSEGTLRDEQVYDVHPSELVPPTELNIEVKQPIVQAPSPTQLNISAQLPRSSRTSPVRTDFQGSPHVYERESNSGLSDFPPHPETSQGPSKRSKLGLPFFRQKPTPSAQYKAGQMKELKRMIRAGKPSYEQIHSWRNSFETLLNDRFGLALFKDFLSTEFSDENIEFWIACQEYKKIRNSRKLAMRAQQIFDQFIAVQAVREVNLDSKTRLETEAAIANPTLHTLDNAQKRIQALMEKDSYRRFLRSDVYLALYSEAREVAKAVAASALAHSLQEASQELEGAVLNLVTSSSSNSPFSFLTNFGANFNASAGTGLNLPGVAAAAATAEAGMNSVQDLQLLGLSTSRHMRNSRKVSTSDASSGKRSLKSEHDSNTSPAGSPSTPSTSEDTT